MEPLGGFGRSGGVLTSGGWGLRSEPFASRYRGPWRRIRAGATLSPAQSPACPPEIRRRQLPQEEPRGCGEGGSDEPAGRVAAARPAKCPEEPPLATGGGKDAELGDGAPRDVGMGGHQLPGTSAGAAPTLPRKNPPALQGPHLPLLKALSTKSSRNAADPHGGGRGEGGVCAPVPGVLHSPGRS